MPPIKFTVSDVLDQFQGQWWRSFKKDKMKFTEFTKSVEPIFESVEMMTFVSIKPSVRQWQSRKQAWYEEWSWENGHPSGDTIRMLEKMRIWFWKDPQGDIIYRSLHIDASTLSMLPLPYTTESAPVMPTATYRAQDQDPNGGLDMRGMVETSSDEGDFNFPASSAGIRDLSGDAPSAYTYPPNQNNAQLPSQFNNLDDITSYNFDSTSSNGMLDLYNDDYSSDVAFDSMRYSSEAMFDSSGRPQRPYPAEDGYLASTSSARRYRSIQPSNLYDTRPAR